MKILILVIFISYICVCAASQLPHEGRLLGSDDRSKASSAPSKVKKSKPAKKPKESKESKVKKEKKSKKPKDSKVKNAKPASKDSKPSKTSVAPAPKPKPSPSNRQQSVPKPSPKPPAPPRSNPPDSKPPSTNRQQSVPKPSPRPPATKPPSTSRPSSSPNPKQTPKPRSGNNPPSNPPVQRDSPVTKAKNDGPSSPSSPPKKENNVDRFEKPQEEEKFSPASPSKGERFPPSSDTNINSDVKVLQTDPSLPASTGTNPDAGFDEENSRDKSIPTVGNRNSETNNDGEKNPIEDDIPSNDSPVAIKGKKNGGSYVALVMGLLALIAVVAGFAYRFLAGRGHRRSYRHSISTPPSRSSHFFDQLL